MFLKPITLLATVVMEAAAQSIYSGDAQWAYKGCFNETTNLNGSAGLRALNNGPTATLATMTVPVCLTSCKGYKYAGVEYTKFVASPPSTRKDYE